MRPARERLDAHQIVRDGIELRLEIGNEVFPHQEPDSLRVL